MLHPQPCLGNPDWESKYEQRKQGSTHLLFLGERGGCQGPHRNPTRHPCPGQVSVGGCLAFRLLMYLRCAGADSRETRGYCVGVWWMGWGVGASGTRGAGRISSLGAACDDHARQCQCPAPFGGAQGSTSFTKAKERTKAPLGPSAQDGCPPGQTAVGVPLTLAWVQLTSGWVQQWTSTNGEKMEIGGCLLSEPPKKNPRDSLKKLCLRNYTPGRAKSCT